MQGTYKGNGLPRPYYMKPSSKRKNSPYDNLKSPVAFFNSPPRKILGYLVLLLLFGTCMYWISQDLKPSRPPVYEVVKPEIIQASVNVPKNAKVDNKNIERIVNVGSKADKESLNIDLADNLAQGSKGEKGVGVAEAPKGGIANEAPVVGSDEEKIVGLGKKPKAQQQAASADKGAGNGESKGYKAAKSGQEGSQQVPQKIANKPPKAGAGAGAGAGAAVVAAGADAEEDDDLVDPKQKAKVILDESE
ncbi:uncharacterized protein RJT20DRAFT_34780 [Scheffersomyces xylosifermentans]|uniref:uncharacterized protein n=1 Tax=Scheffersomyces xylosifermentans TaxID=1304137 RepID=UPI00315CCBFA